MEKNVRLDLKSKFLPDAVLVLGIAITLALWTGGLNIIAVIGAAFCCIAAVLVAFGIFVKKRIYVLMLIGYVVCAFGIATYYIFNGADAGWGAITTALKGFSSADNALWQGEGNFGTRLAGNVIISAPAFLVIVALVAAAWYLKDKGRLQRILTGCISIVLIVASVVFVLTMNLRSKPNVERMWEGHDEYLAGIKGGKTKADSPNVLFILMDDLGYGDVSLNGSVIDTPNIDSIGENGLNFENFYSAYSVCSPARFAAMTGRYPYRGYADNVVYPTVASFSPFASTRLFNSFEMGANCDGMLGDEITIAETLKAAGYNTGLFGKWHLGDYGEYLPTNQGFDYFYGSHHVNDMNPFYHVRESGGEYEIAVGADELRDQSNATKLIHNEITSWITEQAQKDEPFFACYTTPWPHAPVYVGSEFDGATGMGVYADCVTEFDYYLGQLFDTMKELDVFDNTIIVFTSDNGPALQGSTGELRGGKYLAYEGGQKVPFMIEWNDGGADWKADKTVLTEDGRAVETVTSQATLTDLFPTLVDLCGVESKDGKTGYLPSDRVIDGVSMVPLLDGTTDVIHGIENPILYMKREEIKSVSFSISTEELKAMPEYADYDYPVLEENGFVAFKYFRNMQNDNPAFFNMTRKNWLILLTDDAGENYNRAEVYPTIAERMNDLISEKTREFSDNRRGIVR